MGSRVFLRDISKKLEKLINLFITYKLLLDWYILLR